MKNPPSGGLDAHFMHLLTCELVLYLKNVIAERLADVILCDKYTKCEVI